MIGQIISHYKILEKLGEGGMGVVYKALDTKLDRTLALKFLPPHIVHDEAEAARFLQEAKAASSLNHPNVCTIHDIHLGEDMQFIVMEYVDGITLRGFCSASSPLDTVLQLAIQIGEALQEAHAKGIVHRDIKAENIMVTKSHQVKVMDFGLAKLKGSLKLTKTASTVGTLAYMAPEHIQGAEVDARCDIFSFGIVLYEMLTGVTPFSGEHEAALIYSILNADPEPTTKYRTDLPAELLHILNRALEKDPSDRYQSMQDMLIDLRRVRKQSARVQRSVPVGQADSAVAVPAIGVAHTVLPAQPAPRRFRLRYGLLIAGGVIVVAAVLAYFILAGRGVPPGGPPGSKQMIAVLPFENLGSPDQEYFADGMTEEVTSRLAGVSGLGVIARSSAKLYKKSTKTLQQIGDELHVGYILQGTIRYGKAADERLMIRVIPALIRVSDGTEVWSEPYESVFSDVFKIQADMATRVAGSMGVSLLQQERKALDVRTTENPEAYNYYVRGNEAFDHSISLTDFNITLKMYERAITLDPSFAQAYAAFSMANSLMYWYRVDHSPERIAKAREMAERALSLNPDLAGAHVALGYCYYYGALDYENALREFAIAQKQQPSVEVIFGIGAVQRRQGKFEEAVASMAKAAQLDPRSMNMARNLAETYFLLRNYGAAEREFNRGISLSPEVPICYIEKALLYLVWDGATARARAELRQCPQSSLPETMHFASGDIILDMIDGNYQGALARLDMAQPAFSDQYEFVPRWLLSAQVYGLMGKREKERAAYDSARVLLEQRVREMPEDDRLHSALGIAYAGLGRKDEALREATRGVELLPLAKEAWRGEYRLRDLARVNAMTGNSDQAVQQLETLLSMPSELSVQYVRIDPIWTPLRGNPKFQKLAARSEQGT